MKQHIQALLKVSLLFVFVALTVQPCFPQVFAMAQKSVRVTNSNKTPLTNVRKLRDVLKDFQTTYHADFLYDGNAIDKVTLVAGTIDYTLKIEKNLDKLLEYTNLRYKKIKEGSFAILEKSKNEKVVDIEVREKMGMKALATEPLTVFNNPRLILPNERITIFAEQTISGKIVDENGVGIPGVNISIKGSSRGVSSNGDGFYKIDVPNAKTVLVFSFVGYISQEITVDAKSIINVSLQIDNKALEEVVVVGYGTQKKASLTGAVSTIDAKAIENRPVSNVANAMQGLSAGLVVTRGTGQPGNEGVGIQIRGATSANGRVDPLTLVDGVTVSSFTLQTLNPNDIESISVLKDASAAAIYGAQAAGGVILITTKKGKAGKTLFEYSAQYGTDWTINVPERMPLLEEAEYANLARRNAGSGPEYSDVDLQRIRDNIPYVVNPSDSTRYIFYNQEDLITQIIRKTTPMQTHNLSMRGGNEKMNFLISFGYYGKQGAFKLGPDRLDRYNGRINLGTQLSKYFSLDTRIAYTFQQTQSPSSAVDGTSLLYQVYRHRTRYPIFTPEGRLNGGAGASANNTYATLKEGGYDNFDRNFIDGVVTLTAAEFVKGLKLRAILGQQFRVGDRERFARTVELWGRFSPVFYINNPNSFTTTNEIIRNTNLQYLADYDILFGKSKIHLLGGYQWEDNRFTSVSTSSTTLVNNDQPTLNLGDDKTKTNSETINTYAFQSFFGRFSYNYNDKYLFEATLRSDESSRLAPGLRVKVFPSASLGWNMHRETWFAKALPLFSEFKVRGSWGRLGNALGIGFYDYLSLLSRGSNLVLGGVESRASYFFQNSVPSTSLSWETIETSNYGLDFSFFKNKLQLSGDYYVKFNRNMLTPLQLPATFGVGTPRINNGELKSWGWEVEAKYRNKIGKDLNYSIGFNLSDNQNKLISYDGRRVLSPGTVSLLEGYPLNTFWGYKTDGYFQTDDEVKAAAFQDSRTGAGDVKYVDLNNDKRISVGKGSPDDPGDLVYLGTDQPRYTFGINLSMQWKGIDFSAFVQGVGERSFLPGAETLQPFAQSQKSPLTLHRDYWTPENPNAAFPRPFLQGGFRYLPSDKWLMNGQYARLKNIQLGYSLPENLLRKISVSRARIFVSGQDVFTFNRLGVFNKYFDPEQRNNVDNDYPFFGTIVLGLNLTF